MGSKKKVMKSTSFPVYVWLKSPNPYHGKVRINGIEISSKKTVVENTQKLAMLKPIEAFINIEPVNAEQEEVVAETEEKVTEQVTESESTADESNARVQVNEN